MTDAGHQQLNPKQLSTLQSFLHHGAASASKALASWIGKPSVIEIDSLEQVPLEEATGVLAGGDAPICFCSVELSGILSGQMMLAFDDASGLALADLLLDLPPGTSTEWTEMTTSAVLETANIICCAYLNALSRDYSESGSSSELLPSPPRFSRDFAESLLEFAVMGQVMAADRVILARTRFEIDAASVSWTLLFVPDDQSMSRLLSLLPPEESSR